jgi:dipeptidyl aminopeptidase/acylaminoacyl peptidase
MPRPLPLVFLAVLCFAFAPVLRSAETTPAKSPISAADLLNIRQLETPALSPDGRWVVYVVRSIEAKPDAKEDWIYQTQLWLTAADGKTPPRPLTFGAARNSSPVWSPAGDRIAFVRSIEKEKPQVYLLPLTGGEAMPVTKLDTGAGNPRWSPDGTKILFTTSLSHAQVRAALEKAAQESAPAWRQEKPKRTWNDTANWAAKKTAKEGDKTKPDLSAEASAKADGTPQEMRDWLAKNEADGNPRVMNRLNFLAEGDLAVEPTYNRFYTVAATEGAEPVAINLGYEGFAGAEWLADGRGIVCSGPRDLKAHPDRDRLSSLYTIDLATGAAKVLLEEPGMNYDNPLPSPDGKSIAYTVRTGGEFTFEQVMVAVVPAAGGTPKVLTADLDRSATGLKWSPNSRFIHFTAANRGRFPLYRVSLEQGDTQLLTHQVEWGIRDYAIGNDVLVQVVTNPTNPWELYTGTRDGKIARPLTCHNSTWLKDKQLSPYTGHRLVQADGITVDYWTIKPANFDPAKKYPLLVQIHGGPSAMWGPGEQSMWHEFQFFAARGYVVMFANPRGSGGYGRDFQRANFKDWGVGPASDVLAAASFIAKEPYVDASRQVLTGGSYGGYLTAWIVGHDHRFKAAVAQRGVYDLATFYGEGNAWFLVPLYWGGYPWQPEVRTLLNFDSPLTYVDKIKTPLLIQHGDVDFRTGVIQSQVLYKSLKQLGRDVEYVRYPRATHELSRSGELKQRLDTLVRYEEFFRRYIGEN